MNKLFFLPLLILVILTACKNDKAEDLSAKAKGPVSEMINNPVNPDGTLDTNAMARIRFEEPVFEFGEVKEGTVVTHKFKFANVGQVPLTILKARSTCGCTVPEWPEEPIPPGGTAEIEAKFNTEGKTGEQSKTITVTANTYPNDTKVTLKGKVSGE